MIDSPEDQ
jgi:hypothetical protein